MDDTDNLERKIKELEIELEDAKSLSDARERLLRANIDEIREFDAILTRANRLSSLGELAASIAHEIKNPLISIQGFAKRIPQAKEQEKVETYAKYIDHEAERLSTVLAKLLEFSRMAEPAKEPVDANGLVDDTLLFLEHHLTRFKNVALKVEHEPDLPPIHGDKIHIQQALINLVMNAAQAMPDGGQLVIRTGRKDAGHGFIAVSDQGPGITEENMEKIFEPFFTTKPKGEGTGLGLPLCKRLVEANQGRLEVEST
ncbi:MAG: ATPase, partial [Deltaproteobacteria bacterium]|nr:ATPase [Deltaproteobacteria bacterium]